MGTRITKVTPLEGVAAETAGALTLFLAEKLSIPVSTTHHYYRLHHGRRPPPRRLSAVRWGVTIKPALGLDTHHSVSALLAAVVYYI